jgi:hypothetical protein
MPLQLSDYFHSLSQAEKWVVKKVGVPFGRHSLNIGSAYPVRLAIEEEGD